MYRRKKQPWREALAKLTSEQKDLMLHAVLEWQLDQLAGDSDVRFREAEDGDPDDFYWDSCGDSLIGLP